MNCRDYGVCTNACNCPIRGRLGGAQTKMSCASKSLAPNPSRRAPIRDAIKGLASLAAIGIYLGAYYVKQGRWHLGLLCLIFCLTPIPAMIALIKTMAIFADDDLA